ncbi:MAG: hypothetical protein R8G66_18605 [Cytophagales bacterium]|nr:hypothetical protein [Cytophagales bacterium]
MSEARDGKEMLDLPVITKALFTIIGIILIGIGFVIIVLHLNEMDKYPSPDEMEVSFLIGIGLITLFAAYFPWLKLKIGDFEVERAVEDQARDYQTEIKRLREFILKQEKEVNAQEAISVDIKQSFAKQKEEFGQDAKDKEIIYELLKRYPNDGFNITRIKNFETGFNTRQDISSSKIRVLANELVDVGKARTRISKTGNILYQAMK